MVISAMHNMRLIIGILARFLTTDRFACLCIIAMPSACTKAARGVRQVNFGVRPPANAAWPGLAAGLGETRMPTERHCPSVITKASKE